MPTKYTEFVKNLTKEEQKASQNLLMLFSPDSRKEAIKALEKLRAEKQKTITTITELINSTI